MARYIDLDKVEFLKADGNKEFNHGVDCCINKLLKIEPADVIERSEYEYLKKENRELAIKYDNAMNMVTDGLEEISKLRFKIDKAIEEINNAEVEVDFMNDYSNGFNSGLFKALEILKRNIGEQIMKYTIELTENQKKQMDLLCELAHRYIGFNPKLELIKTTNVEDTNEYQIGYKVGFEDGKKQAISEIPEIANNENEMYNRGYNTAINDYNAMYEWLHDCFVDFEKFLLEKGLYTDEKFSDGFVVGQLMYDLICDHDIAEVIREFKKWQEEKKKAEDESIKVGDEVITSNGYIAIITFICGEYMTAIFDDGSSGEFINETLKKTGRHFGEVEQIIDKLRGEE